MLATLTGASLPDPLGDDAGGRAAADAKRSRRAAATPRAAPTSRLTAAKDAPEAQGRRAAVAREDAGRREPTQNHAARRPSHPRSRSPAKR